MLLYGHCEIRTHDFLLEVLVFKTSAIDQTRPNTHMLCNSFKPHPLPGAVLYTVLGAICVIYYVQLDCAYMAYLLYCGITNPHWCQLCSISIWVYIVNPSGERVSNRVYSTLVYRLNVSSRYTHGNQLFSTRAHCCNQSLALSMPSTVLLALLFMIYACYDVLVCNV